MADSSLRVIDLFSGAGGLTLGFRLAGEDLFRPVWANDFNEYACATYQMNFGGHAVAGDILEILVDTGSIPEADVVVGGPPCQGFSLLNKGRNGDHRRSLWRPFLDVVRLVGARAFVMENVPQLLGSREHEAIVHGAEELGFMTASAKLCAADYGVPQTRHRAFIVGSSVCDPTPFFPPKRTHFKADNLFLPKLSEELSDYVPQPRPWRTVRDAIADLPPPKGTEITSSIPPPLDLHFGRNPTAKSVARYRAIPEEGMNRFDLQARALELTPQCWIRKKTGGTDLFGRLWWDRPAFTIRTEFFKPEKGRYLGGAPHP